MFEQLVDKARDLIPRLEQQLLLGPEALPPEKRVLVPELDAWYNSADELLKGHFGDTSGQWRDWMALHQRLVELDDKEALGGYFDVRRSKTRRLANSMGFLLQLDLSGGTASSAFFDQYDLRVLAALRTQVPAAAFSYEQAIRDLAGPDRLSWRGPATDLRESLRETIDQLAPDNLVENEPTYKREPSTSGPTMRQSPLHTPA